MPILTLKAAEIKLNNQKTGEVYSPVLMISFFLFVNLSHILWEYQCSSGLPQHRHNLRKVPPSLGS